MTTRLITYGDTPVMDGSIAYGQQVVVPPGPTPPLALTSQDTLTILRDQSTTAALSNNSTTITLG